jgi:hypothetical protein
MGAKGSLWKRSTYSVTLRKRLNIKKRKDFRALVEFEAGDVPFDDFAEDTGGGHYCGW